MGGSAILSVGSSPLTRGAHRRLHQRSDVCRLIPAHAGSTLRQQGSADPHLAHPRSRGEHVAKDGTRTCVAGSSPLTRGAHRHRDRVHVCDGLIPTHAGSTCPEWKPAAWGQAHPHSRGEHRTNAVRALGVAGSSPLTRGARGHRSVTSISFGLIPTHAGSTRYRVSCSRTYEAHPHSRGEHPFQVLTWGVFPGSSPLTRGAPVPRP